jgi:hypothetical protein
MYLHTSSHEERREGKSQSQINMAFTLPALTYDYAALEPYVDATTMNIHHTKHHNVGLL